MVKKLTGIRIEPEVHKGLKQLSLDYDLPIGEVIQLFKNFIHNLGKRKDLNEDSMRIINNLFEMEYVAIKQGDTSGCWMGEKIKIFQD